MNTLTYTNQPQENITDFTSKNSPHAAIKKNTRYSIMIELEEFQKYLKHVLTEAKHHSADITEKDINVASITVDMKALSDYLYKFSGNLNKVLGYQDFGLSHAVFFEIQHFIKYKTKSLKYVVPYKESTINHSDWWGKTFKQITQKVWELAEKASVILPGHHINTIQAPLTPPQILDKLIEICAPCWTIGNGWNLSLIKKMQILDYLDRLQLWKESKKLQNDTAIENTKKWLSSFDKTIIVNIHYIIISELYADLTTETKMKIPSHLLVCLRDLKNSIRLLLKTSVPFSSTARIQELFVLLDNRIQTLKNRNDENGKIKREIFENLRNTLLNIVKVFNSQSSQSKTPLALCTALQNLISDCFEQNKLALLSNRNALWKTGKIFKNTFYTIITCFMYPCYNWYTTRRCFFPTTSSHIVQEINMLLLEIIEAIYRDETLAEERNHMLANQDWHIGIGL